jgi:fructokinase
MAVFGEALFDFIEHAPSEFKSHVGGSPFNVAVGFSRLGLDSIYLSPISTDNLGEKILLSAANENVNVFTNNRSSKPTSLALVYKDIHGQPDYCLYRDNIADLDITTEKLLSLVPDNIEVFHTGSLALVPRMIPVLMPVIIELKKRGVKISVDVNLRQGVEQDNQKYIESVQEFIKVADILKVSDEDLLLLDMKGSPLEEAKAILSAMGSGLVALTLGDQGAYLLNGSNTQFVEVLKAENFVDAVGAGDTFFAALLTYLSEKQLFIHLDDLTTDKMLSTLNFARTAASMNVERQGCQPPYRHELLDLL